MLIYILSLFIPSCFYLLNINLIDWNKKYFNYLFITYLIIFIGLRQHTGGDWGGHLQNFYFVQNNFDLFNFDFRGDYFYDLLNFIVAKSNGSFYLFNLILASFLVLSVYLYSSFLPQRFLVLLISFPYLFVIVGMGYVRQGLAISFIFICLYLIKKNKIFYYYLLIILAILSHKSSIIIIGISFFINKRYLFRTIIISFGLFLTVYFFLQNDLVRLYYYYIGKGVYLESQGSIFRNAFNVLPVIILFLFYNRFKLFVNIKHLRIYFFFSIIQIILFITSFHLSTFADRMTIYTIPLQLFVYSYFSLLFDNKYKILINSFILILFNTYFLTWVFFGQFVLAWSGYQNILIEYFINFPVIPLQ